ncbi:hypothetical protein AOCH_000749 [Aspergillus ochraceoroseus]|uniref:YMC020W-like alpha/beta hydrolase domain-containing protein n=1 Tax=Aspergillus ochraceoroseus TaxID=138278 RepID=A0A0F8TZJ3_9EURO|nr:hypothetical protein AOCH_000749 [Aspergillus ochraceoroseus]
MASSGSRKRVKPSPSGPDSRSFDGVASPNEERSSLQSARWYPGVWPAASRSSKAAPVTEVARESISMAKHTLSNLTSASTPQLEAPKPPRNPSLQLTRKAGASTRSLPADATTTRINIASDGTASTPSVDVQPDPTTSSEQTTDKETPKDSAAIVSSNTSEPQVATTNPDAAEGDAKTGNTSTTETQPSGWLSWFYSPVTNDTAATSDSPADSPADLPADAPLEPPATEAQATQQDSSSTPADSALEQQDKPPETIEISSTSQKRSWLQMWYGSSSSTGPEEPKGESPQQPEEPAPFNPTERPNPKEDNVTPGVEESSLDPDVPTSKPSGWSFWFKDNTKDPTQGKAPDAQRVEGSTTQEQPMPQPASELEYKSDRKTEITKKGSVKIKSPSSGLSLPDNAIQGLETRPNVPTSTTPEAAAASKQLQKIIPNQVVPQFKDTFALQDSPTLLQSIGRFLHYTKEPNNKHVYKVPNPPHIKKALAIGIHGYFPAPLIRSVLGQPTGTSVRFSNMAAEAIRKYTDDHGYTCEIEKIALEGEGRIAERVDLLWKLLLSWMEKIRSADFILFACHSQGVPVGIMLVAKLISFGCLNANRVGICAMAGVNMGPFSDYRSRWISGSAGELFEFALPYSQVSKDYEASLKDCIDFGVRISYIGSIDDQLVSLESSLFSPVSHPYIYRAVFVDGRFHAPSFVSHLVGFALKLRNLGISDHGLIRELSSPLAGSLYTGEGHSRLYDDDAVYRLAIEFALETSIVSSASLHIKRSHPPTPANPYILPFAMRGLLEEEYVRRELLDETMELLKQFDEWKPTSKVLKDVKFRLEGIRSKL